MILLHCVKVSVFGVILVRIQSECGKIRTTITPNTDTFHAVPILNKIAKTAANTRQLISIKSPRLNL